MKASANSKGLDIVDVFASGVCVRLMMMRRICTGLLHEYNQTRNYAFISIASVIVADEVFAYWRCASSFFSRKSMPTRASEQTDYRNTHRM